MQPHRRQPTRLPRPWDSPGKNTGVGCRFLLQCMKVKSESKVAQSCPTLSDPMDCSLPGSSIHGIFHARVLEWGENKAYLELNERMYVQYLECCLAHYLVKYIFTAHLLLCQLCHRNLFHCHLVSSVCFSVFFFFKWFSQQILKFYSSAWALLIILPELTFVLKNRGRALDWKENDLEVDE